MKPANDFASGEQFDNLGQQFCFVNKFPRRRALGGSVELQGPGGSRTVSADDFFQGYFETALQPDELLTAVRVPRRPGTPWGYQKFVRRANDWAIVGVAAIDGRIALANMGPRPLRAAAAEAGK